MNRKYRVSFEERWLTEKYYARENAAGITVAIRIPGFCSVGVEADGAESAEKLGWEALAANESDNFARDKWKLISIEPIQSGEVLLQDRDPSQIYQVDRKQ